MNPGDSAVILGGLVLIALLAWYFFAPQKATHAQVKGGRQVVDITVKGGYSPNFVRVEAGTPVRLRFDRQESSDCTARVVFPDLRKSASLAAFGTTTLDLDITEPGEYSWACGMNMLHGTLVADAPDGGDGGEQSQAEQGETPFASPARDAGERCERAEFLLTGALSSLPTDVARSEAQLWAIGGVDKAEINFGAERAVIMYDPSLVDAEGLTKAVATATGFPARLRSDPGSPGGSFRRPSWLRGSVASAKIDGLER